MSGALAIVINVDLGEIDARLKHIAAEERPAIAHALTDAVKLAKKEFVQRAVIDSVGGKSYATKFIKAQVGRVQGATAGNLTAKQTIRTSKFPVSPIVRSMKRGNQYRPGGGTIATFLLTGGGSASLTSEKFFEINGKGGGRAVLERIAGAKGSRRLTRGTVHRLAAGMPITMFAQEDSVPRRTWDNVLDSTLAFRISANLQAVFDGAPAPASTASEE